MIVKWGNPCLDCQDETSLQKCMAYLQNRFYSYGSIHYGADMRFLRQLYDNGFSIFSDNEAQKVFLSFSFFFSVKVVVVGSGFEYPSSIQFFQRVASIEGGEVF